MRYVTLPEAIDLYRRIIEQTGGAYSIRDIGSLRSALAQPRMTFGGHDLYPTASDKAAALGFAVITNHPFLDGNKRTGHALMETFLVLNGHELAAEVDEQERVILSVAAGQMGREVFADWVRAHLRPARVDAVRQADKHD